jgi:hypothetical protein
MLCSLVSSSWVPAHKRDDFVRVCLRMSGVGNMSGAANGPNLHLRKRLGQLSDDWREGGRASVTLREQSRPREPSDPIQVEGELLGIVHLRILKESAKRGTIKLQSS